MNFTEKVLFVDDEPNILSAIKRQLHNQFNIETAPSGDVAITKLIDEGPFAVIVVDMRMPGMDGLETLKELKKKSPLTEVIMLTGHGSIESGMQGMQLGAFDYVVKPADFEELFEKINQAGERRMLHEERIRKNLS